MKPQAISKKPIIEKLKLFASPIHAGFPSPANDYVEHELDFNELIIRNPSTTYCLRVSGESMAQAGINTDDIVVVDRSLSAQHNDIVVAELDGEFTLKRLVHEQGKIVLRSENPDFTDITLEGSMELSIFGVVTFVVKQTKKYDSARRL